jgi:hypothetical protein
VLITYGSKDNRCGVHARQTELMLTRHLQSAAGSLNLSCQMTDKN